LAETPARRVIIERSALHAPEGARISRSKEDCMATVTLNVPDISCEHCQRTIIEALSPVHGVRSVTVDIQTKQVRVDYDESHIDVERLKAILQEEDYPVASGR
jgi:copper chaperone